MLSKAQIAQNAVQIALVRIYIHGNLRTKCHFHLDTLGKSPTFVKSRRRHEEKENSRERAAASVRHVGHLLQYGRDRGSFTYSCYNGTHLMRCEKGRVLFTIFIYYHC